MENGTNTTCNFWDSAADSEYYSHDLSGFHPVGGGGGGGGGGTGEASPPQI